MLPDSEIENIKKQIILQIDATFPEDKKEAAKKQIIEMNPEQLEEFLIRNNLVKPQNTQKTPAQQTQCVFCSIVSNQIKSYWLEENEKAIAVFEINPISSGHIIVIPKEHISSSDKISKEAFALAKEISKRIKSKLKPKDILIETSNVFGHEIINLIPIYKDENINSNRKQSKPEELEHLQEILKKKEKTKIKKQKTEKIIIKNSEKLWLPRRVP